MVIVCLIMYPDTGNIAEEVFVLLIVGAKPHFIIITYIDYVYIILISSG